ncbi:MAG: type II toxin-antitoxin system HicA family toxin [Phycisphaerales bacterium]|jgi:predicted RNA binding protein YcfA (HicA-like mRNA interferase family)|nr:type II toxin-antitoxin system HicA family toxin [Phycisphaerales bacterium]
MGSAGKILERILRGQSDANIAFRDVRNLLLYMGFEERISGSHHIFRKQGIRQLINLQKDGNRAKPYQIRQIRHIILEYKLTGVV